MAIGSLSGLFSGARNLMQDVADIGNRQSQEQAALEAKRKELADAGIPFLTTDKLGDLVFEKDSFYTDYKIDGKVIGKDFVFYDPTMSKGAKASNQVVRYTGGIQPEYRYTFIPENIIEKGFKTDGKQHYLGNLLAGDNLDSLSQNGVYVDLAGIQDFDKEFEKQGLSTKGFIIPYAETQERKLFSNIKNYEIGKKSDDNKLQWNEIEGLSKVGDQYVYATKTSPIGGASQASGYIDSGGLKGNWYKKPSGGGFLGDLGRSIAKIPFGAELLGLASALNPITAPYSAAIYGGAAGLRGGGTGQDPLKVGLETGLKAGLATELANALPSGTPGAVGGTPGVSEVFPVAPPQIGVAPLPPAGTLGAGAGATGGLLGADAAFAADYATTLAGQGLSEAAIAQNLAEAGLNTANSTLAANLAAAGSGATEIANTLASLAPSGTSSLFSGTAADLANFGITAGGAGIALTPAQLQAIQAGQIAGGTFAEQVANAQKLLPAGIGAGTAAAGGGLLDKLGDAAKGLLGTDLSSMLGSLLNAGIDYETARRIADQAREEGKSILDKAQELGRQGQLPQSVLDNLNTLATTTAQQFREAGAAAQVPFTPYTVTTGAGTATMGPGQATATAADPYARIQQQAQQQAFNTLTAMNPAQASQTLFDQMQALTQPVQQRQQQQLLGTLGQRGLLGFGQNLPTVGGATRTVNPLLESLLSAQGAERAQQGLQATQFGTSEAQRQAALSQALTAQAQGIDEQTLGLLGLTNRFGSAEQNLAQVNAAQRLRADMAGLGLPLSTALDSARLQQRGLEFAANAGLAGQRAALPLQLQAGLIEAGRTQNLADVYRSAVNEIFG